ncbi:putative Mitogen-activated protein kinase [Blattamonas nauphoetae]|uniref:Mitogen-activated protein kinase n=1 Tax=Blattamonas nauphoetae TaxID=2049346 RepID=A0ABQ9X5Z5_9EUKA|nr:putative Mitogen-activated protein kinase [Blattamonas nauphoetae]
MALSKASIFQIQIHRVFIRVFIESEDPDSQKQSFSLVLRPPTADDVVDTLVVALHPSSFQSPDRLLLDLSEIATQRFLRVAASALYQTCDTLQDAFSTQSDLHTALGMIFQPLAPVVVLSVSESSYCLCLLLQYLSTLVNPSPSTETLLQADSYGMFLFSKRVAFMTSKNPTTFSFTIPKGYSVEKLMGRGTYGVVCAATNTKTNERVAIKKVHDTFDRTLDLKRALREIRILTRVSHQNVLSCKDLFKPPSFAGWRDLYWTSELMQSDLHKILSSSQTLTDEHIQFFMYQVVCGLRYLHSANIVHRDLKPANILINRNCDLKIADFGLVSSDSPDVAIPKTLYVQTRWYRAPELLLGNTSYTPAVDVWSLGCILIEMYIRRPAFTGSNYMSQLERYYSVLPLPTDHEMKLIEKRKACEFLRSLPTPKYTLKSFFAHHKVTVPPEAIDLISKLLQFDPTKRPTLDSVLTHPFLRSYRGSGDETLYTSSTPLLDLRYEAKSTKQTLKHILFHEMLRFHPNSAKDLDYSLPPEERVACEIANPDICSFFNDDSSVRSKINHSVSIDSQERLKKPGSKKFSSIVSINSLSTKENSRTISPTNTTNTGVRLPTLSSKSPTCPSLCSAHSSAHNSIAHSHNDIVVMPSLCLCLVALSLSVKFKGKTFNLEPLTKTDKTYYSFDAPEEKIHFNVLKPLDLSVFKECESQPSDSLAVSLFGDPDMQVCWNVGLSEKSTYTLLSNPAGLQISYKSDQSTDFVMNFLCGKEASQFVGNRDANYNYEVNITHPGGCGKGGGNDVFGIVFFIILLVAVVLYFAIGIPICACGMKKTGKEVIPFINFWIALPKLFIDGIKFMFSPCCKSKADYTEGYYKLASAFVFITSRSFHYCSYFDECDCEVLSCTVKMGASNSKAIADKYKNILDVQNDLRKNGLESSNLVFGIDYTKSNLYMGKDSFGGRCLHDVTVSNPYTEVIQILGETLEPFDDDHIIPTFGFGDAYTADKSVFPFYPDKEPHGFREVLERYVQITPGITMSGPTSFAPIVNKTIEIVKQRKGYHILVIVTDGQVTSEAETIEAIREASKYPISIVCIGVGDGPWDEMVKLDDRIKGRKFDNFQFVDFMALRRRFSENFPPAFSLHCLMEIPQQYKLIRKLGLL